MSASFGRKCGHRLSRLRTRMTRSDQSPPRCPAGCGCGANEFGEDSAKRDLEAYRRNGPDRTTRWLIDGLRGGADGSAPASTPGLAGQTVLDIGAGVGA